MCEDSIGLRGDRIAFERKLQKPARPSGPVGAPVMAGVNFNGGGRRRPWHFSSALARAMGGNILRQKKPCLEIHA